MKKIKLLITIILVLFCSNSFAGEKANPNPESQLYPSFKIIKTFGYIGLDLTGTAEKIGLKHDELTDYLRLRFKNSFANFEYMENDDIASAMSDKKIAPTIGSIQIKIWTGGEEHYPIAIHIKLSTGNLPDSDDYVDEYLGTGSKSSIPTTVKKDISTMIDKLAIAFFKARGELYWRNKEKTLWKRTH